jgi:RHS repeat-associated protein
MEMVGRAWSEGSEYRQGYNGKENDKDFGEGVQDYGMRISDTQTARFFSVDPITAQYPELTPYQFASNRPIDGIDLDGLEYAAGFGMAGNQRRVYQESRDHDIKNPKQYTAEEIAKANSFVADWIPIISQTKAGTEVATGIDPITKKPSSRVLAAMGFVPFGKFIGKAVKGLGQGVNWAWNGVTSIFRKRKKGKVEVGEVEVIATESVDGIWRQPLPKMDRVKMFVENLNNAKPASSFEEAKNLINKTLDDIEDRYSGIAKNSDAINMPNIEDGRMYGILDNKYIKQLEDGTIRAFTRKNTIIFDQKGGFNIYVRDKSQSNQIGKLILKKAGKGQ